MIDSTIGSAVEARARRWACGTLLFTILVAAGFAGANRAINRYGVFGDVSGRQLVVGQDESLTKYLFARNYVPANFDGLLIGSSITDNWDTALIRSARVFNVSTLGAYASDEAAIAANVFDRRRLAVVVITMHPHLTAEHDPRAGLMQPTDSWSALGSVQLIQTYVEDFLVRVGRHRSTYDAFGRNDFPPARHPTAAEFAAQPTTLPLDSIAVRQFAALIARAHRSADHVIGVIPPVSDERGPTIVAAFAAYAQTMRALFSPSDSIIDFNTADYAALRSNPKSFNDGVHLAPPTARLISTILADKVDRIVGLPTSSASRR